MVKLFAKVAFAELVGSKYKDVALTVIFPLMDLLPTKCAHDDADVPATLKP